MKAVRIKNIELVNNDTLRLFFTNGDIGTLDRKLLSESSGWKILPKHFKEVLINNDGILTLPIFIDAELEDGTFEEIPIELDPIVIHHLTQIENFEPMRYDVIRNIRKSKGLTLEQVSDCIGVSKQYLGSVERGEIENIGVNTLKRIVEIGLEDKLLLLSKTELDSIISSLMTVIRKTIYKEVQHDLKSTIDQFYKKAVQFKQQSDHMHEIILSLKEWKEPDFFIHSRKQERLKLEEFNEILKKFFIVNYPKLGKSFLAMAAVDEAKK